MYRLILYSSSWESAARRSDRGIVIFITTSWGLPKLGLTAWCGSNTWSFFSRSQDKHAEYHAFWAKCRSCVVTCGPKVWMMFPPPRPDLCPSGVSINAKTSAPIGVVPFFKREECGDVRQRCPVEQGRRESMVPKVDEVIVVWEVGEQVNFGP